MTNMRKLDFDDLWKNHLFDYKDGDLLVIVKEISTELDFPNLSFFGKFVKAHLGMAPTEYRQKNLKEG